MTAVTRARLFGVREALHDPFLISVIVAAGVLLIGSAAIVRILFRRGKIDEKTHSELVARIKSWAIIVPIMIVPVVLGAFWFIVSVGVLSIFCYREFARATGLFRERAISLVVAAGIILLTFAAADHWYAFFVALPPLLLGVMASVAILADQPQGYIQRVALGAFGLLFIGFGLGHFAYFGNDANFRAIVAWLLVGVEMNDVFAYVCGKSFGRRKLAPSTSPNKTIGGALGALVLTTALVALLGHFALRGTRAAWPGNLIVLGILVSVGGQLGDLMLSSLKRDLGIKDMAHLIPGHGGLLDRFDSLLLVAPAVFHYLGYLQGVGLDQPRRIITGSW